MFCDVCQREAILQCTQCQLRFCADHGSSLCFRCGSETTAITPAVQEIPLDSSIYTTEKHSRYTGKSYLQCYTKKKIPTIYLDDEVTPECTICGGYAKHHCHHCNELICPEHRSTIGLCQSCETSSRLGMVVFFGLIGLIAAFILFGPWFF